MKKFILKVFALAVCTLLSVLTFNSTPVKADILSTKHFNLHDGFEEKVVYYVGIAPDKSTTNKYGVIRAIDQRYYKNHNQSLLYGTNPDSMYLRSDFTGLKYNQMCSSGAVSLYFCTSQHDEINDPLVEVAMSYNGDIRIYLKDGYSISNFRLYYLIATYVDTNAEAYCSQKGDICDHAKTIQGQNSNWKNSGRGQILIYNQNSIDGIMDKKEKRIGSQKETLEGYYYSGYNFFDNITSDYRKMAENEGAYVAMSITITNGNGTYYSANNKVMNNSNSEEGFSYVDDRVVNTARKYYSNVVCADAKTECSEVVTSISSFAGLVRPSRSGDVDANEAYGDLNEFFITTLKPIIMIVIGVMFIVSGSMTGVTIMKSSDEPETRKEAIKRLIGLFTGALVIEVILLFYEPIIQFFSGLF